MLQKLKFVYVLRYRRLPELNFLDILKLSKFLDYFEFLGFFRIMIVAFLFIKTLKYLI